MKTWITRDGDEIEISKMTTQHLVNTINFLEKKSKVGVEVVVSYGYEDDNNYMTGDTEILFGQDYLDSVEEYKDLKEELKKRI